MPKHAKFKGDAIVRQLKREEIEKAAHRSVLKHGFPGTSLRVVAKEAGVPLSILHYYFRDKDDLMRRVVQRIADSAMTRLGAVGAAQSDPIRRVEALLETYVMRSTEDWQATLAFIEYWAASVRRGTVDRFYTQVHFRYRELFAEAFREAGADDPEGLALALLGMMAGYATFYRCKPPDPGERLRFLDFANSLIRRHIAKGLRTIRLVSKRTREPGLTVREH